MDIVITKHAIIRYRERLFDFNSSEQEVIKFLKDVAIKGKLVCIKPNDYDNCTEVRYQGISVVLIRECGRVFVITCLGDLRYRKWIKKQKPLQIPKSGI